LRLTGEVKSQFSFQPWPWAYPFFQTNVYWPLCSEVQGADPQL
jgi:hypothetical protein